MEMSLGAVKDNWNATRSSTNARLDQNTTLELTLMRVGQNEIAD